MKILFVTSSLVSGGSERVLTTLANYWNKKGWDIDVFIISTKNKFYSLDEGITLYTSKNYYNNTLLNYTRQLLDIRETIKKVEPSIIISFLDLMNISTILASIGLKIPLLISERNNFDTLKSKHWRAMRRITYPFANGMVVQSTYDFEKYKYVKSKKIIANPLDVTILLDANIENKQKEIIAVGSLSYQKGFDMLIEAINKTDMKDWKCYIIGKGRERDNLQKLIEKYNIEDKISLIGEKKNIFEYYQKASIFVLSSRYEGFPNVLNEAMAHGCASIAFDCKTGPSDMITDGKDGFVIEANNTTALAKQIEFLINNEEEREKISYQAIKVRERNNLNKIASEWEEYLLEVCNG